jgi:hypothetical protein
MYLSFGSFHFILEKRWNHAISENQRVQQIFADTLKNRWIFRQNSRFGRNGQKESCQNLAIVSKSEESCQTHFQLCQIVSNRVSAAKQSHLRQREEGSEQATW